MAVRVAFWAALSAACFRVGATLDRAAEHFTQNTICRQNNCINPVFPGLKELPVLDQILWQCSNQSMVADYLDFCRNVVKYDPALKSPNASRLVKEIVKEQDDKAAEVFFFHLSGLGYDAHEFHNPDRSADPCVRQVWKMACYTYFPKAQAGCKIGESSPYLRPCRNTCESYVTACRVECCDESVQCAFHHEVPGDPGAAAFRTETGYVDADGPSGVCTGVMSAAHRSGVSSAILWLLCALHIVTRSTGGFAGARTGGHCTSRQTVPLAASGRWRVGAFAAALAVCASALQGCVMDVPHHEVGNWRRNPDYLTAYEFIRPGEPANTAVLNSCSAGVPETLQCSGRGYCKEFNPNAVVRNAISFCACDRDWADPECRTRRKSQVTTFLLSLFGGFLGLDYFYLGFPVWGMAKVGTLGGMGLWWLLDIVRSGSGQVYAADFRVASDLPHWVFVLLTVTLFSFVGFVWSIESYLSFRRKKRDDVMKLQESEEARPLGKFDEMMSGAGCRASFPSKNFPNHQDHAGYGSMLPSPLPNGGAPYAMPPATGQAGRYGGPFGPARRMFDSGL
mmetsp:Transcript_109383/g.315028  ORF Transcript_109383/g.315028 Transcript_109383/m.315028 type:complete len:565 (+) Transcript_109383:54-1748(+)